MTRRPSGDSRAAQVRRFITSAGIPGLKSERRFIYGVPGWRFVVTTQDKIASHGVSMFVRLLEMNQESRTAIIRTRMMARTPAPTIADSQVIVRLEDFTELLAYRYEHERTCHE